MNIIKNFSLLSDSLHRLLLAFMTVNILVFSGLVQSAIVYEQLPLDGANGPASFFEEHSAGGFSLTSNTRITSIQWFGSFEDSAISNNNFDIRFFEDDGGVPGTLISETLSVSASRTATGLTDFVGADVFRFSSSISSVSLLASTAYYVSIVHPDDAFNDEFYWLLGSNSGENYTRNTSASDPSWTVGSSASGDLAFSLVPEPSGPLLLLMAFMLFGFYQRSIKV